MINLTKIEIFTLAWISRKVRSDLLVYKLEKDPVLKQVRKQALLDVIKITNEENDGLLEAVFISHIQEDDFHWTDVLNPYFFEISLKNYTEKLEDLLKIK